MVVFSTMCFMFRKYLVVLCAGSTLLLVKSYTPTRFLAPLSGSFAKLADINLQKFGSFSYWFDKP
jgi:hypothetical protein